MGVLWQKPVSWLKSVGLLEVNGELSLRPELGDEKLASAVACAAPIANQQTRFFKMQTLTRPLNRLTLLLPMIQLVFRIFGFSSIHCWLEVSGVPGTD